MFPHPLVAMHTLRYSITTRPLQSGADFLLVQGLLGPVDVSTRMIDRQQCEWRTFRAAMAIGSRCCRNAPHSMCDVNLDSSVAHPKPAAKAV